MADPIIFHIGDLPFSYRVESISYPRITLKGHFGYLVDVQIRSKLESYRRVGKSRIVLMGNIIIDAFFHDYACVAPHGGYLLFFEIEPPRNQC